MRGIRPRSLPQLVQKCSGHRGQRTVHVLLHLAGSCHLCCCTCLMSGSINIRLSQRACTVTTQHNDLPFCRGTSVTPSGLFLRGESKISVWGAGRAPKAHELRRRRRRFCGTELRWGIRRGVPLLILEGVWRGAQKFFLILGSRNEYFGACSGLHESDSVVPAIGRL